MLLTGLLVPGSDAAWRDLQNSLSAGLSFPRFVNPFDIQITSETRYVVANSWDFATQDQPNAANGCLYDEWYKCVQSDDDNLTYLTVGYPYDPLFGVTLNDVPNAIGSTDKVIYFRITATCSTPIGVTDLVSLAFYMEYQPYADSLNLVGDARQKCPRFPEFGTVHFNFERLDRSLSYGDVAQDWDIALGVLGCPNSVCDPQKIAYISYLITQNDREPAAPGTTSCGGDWWNATACALIRFVDIIWKGFLFLVNGIVFAVLSIIAILIFLGTVAFFFLSGVFSIFSSLFNLGAPSAIQYIIDIMAIGLIAWLFYRIVKLIPFEG